MNLHSSARAASHHLVVLALAGSMLAVAPSADASQRPTARQSTAAPAARLSTQLAETGASGLLLTNSFVSSVGWVKPGQTYPSRILVTNPTSSPVVGATVAVTTPEGTSVTSMSTPVGTTAVTATGATWTIGSVPAGSTVQLLLEATAASTSQMPTVVWRDLSTTAVLSVAGAQDATASSRGPKVIPPGDVYETARYGDRPFPVVPVEYVGRKWTSAHSSDQLETVINDPGVEGSTFNLFQEMSLGQLFPHATVPSVGIDTADFDYAPGFDFSHADHPVTQPCTGTTYADNPLATPGGTLYPTRIEDGVYQLPGSTAYYGDDLGSGAILGSLGLPNDIDSACGPTGKLVYDAAVIADPEIDYNDFDTDKDGLVDFMMVVYSGCGGNGASQLGIAGCTNGGPQDVLPYDNVWPHSSSLEYYFTDPTTGLPGYTSDDQLTDLEGRPLFWTDTDYTAKTTTDTGLPAYVRVGPYNVNPESALDKASVISHEYGHSLGLPDFYTTGSESYYGDWTLMATDKSQNIDGYGRQELGWVVPEVLTDDTTVTGWSDSKQDTGTIHWRTPDGTPYTLTDGPDGTVHNSQMYVAKLPGRVLMTTDEFAEGAGASATHAWWSGSGNDYGCTPTGGRNLDLAVPGLADLPAGSTVDLAFKSRWDIEDGWDYGYVLTTTNGGQSYTSHASQAGHTTTDNANDNACQAKYSNGVTGVSDGWVEDHYDISDLVGAANPAVRFSYATDPAVANPGWFIDDLVVTATTPDGTTVLLETDLETTGGPDDPRFFNGGCRDDLTTATQCTDGWTYLAAGDESTLDHAYYLELRDRSGFDLDGHGQVDRDPIDFGAGLSVSYADEARGYGNNGVADHPAQTVLDAVPTAGDITPDLGDAAWTAAAGRSTFSDFGAGHTDNYTDPTNTATGNPWVLAFNCLGFTVTSMDGDGDGPATSDGDLSADVSFDVGEGCGAFNYGYVADPVPDNSDPQARFTGGSGRLWVKQPVAFDAGSTTDAETPLSGLDLQWSTRDGSRKVTGSGRTFTPSFVNAGRHQVTLTATDEGGAVSTYSRTVTVLRNLGCQSGLVDRSGSWRTRRSADALGGTWCDNLGTGSGADVLRATFFGPKAELVHGTSPAAGRATVYVDGNLVRRIDFQRGSSVQLGRVLRIKGLGEGQHSLRLVVTSGRALVDGLTVFRSQSGE